MWQLLAETFKMWSEPITMYESYMKYFDNYLSNFLINFLTSRLAITQSEIFDKHTFQVSSFCSNSKTLSSPTQDVPKNPRFIGSRLGSRICFINDRVASMVGRIPVEPAQLLLDMHRLGIASTTSTSQRLHLFLLRLPPCILKESREIWENSRFKANETTFDNLRMERHPSVINYVCYSVTFVLWIMTTVP